MYIGEQLGDLSDRKLTWVSQLGVEHIVVNTMKDTGIQQEDGTWKVEPIKALAIGYTAPSVVSKLLSNGVGSPRGVDRALAGPRSLRAWWSN